MLLAANFIWPTKHIITFTNILPIYLLHSIQLVDKLRVMLFLNKTTINLERMHTRHTLQTFPEHLLPSSVILPTVLQLALSSINSYHTHTVVKPTNIYRVQFFQGVFMLKGSTVTNIADCIASKTNQAVTCVSDWCYCLPGISCQKLCISCMHTTSVCCLV